MRTLTYTGRRTLRKGGTAHAYIERLSADPDHVALYKRPLGTMTIIGGTVDVEDVNAEVGTVRVVGSSPTSDVPRERIDQWRLDDRAAVGAVEQERAVARLRKEQTDLGDMTLEAIRKRTTRMLPDQRAAIIALVLRYLA